MAGIAGIACSNRHGLVENMLDKIAHRGMAGAGMISGRGATLGVVWAQATSDGGEYRPAMPAVWDAQDKPAPDTRSLPALKKPFALAADRKDGIFLSRDWFGVRPLYYGYSKDGDLCFASEVKALLEVTRDVREFPPGTWYDETTGFHSFGELEPGDPVREPAGQVAAQLLEKLETAVIRRINSGEMGSWLSGGLDSSVIVSLVRPHVRTLHTFAGGLPGAPDLEYARQAAEALDCEHHEILLEEKDLLEVLPEVIYYLESFDALLVRSTIINYLVARRAAEWVDAVFSGEGADELFAGYAYLERIPDEDLPGELLDIVKRLHNTALQRVDRSAAAHGLVPLVPFLDLDVARFVLPIQDRFSNSPKCSLKMR
jgi:asparagine synthase (glutamine-hydrolysing)